MTNQVAVPDVWVNIADKKPAPGDRFLGFDGTDWGLYTAPAYDKMSTENRSKVEVTKEALLDKMISVYGIIKWCTPTSPTA